MVKIVEAEFSIEASELMTAPVIAAKINPRNPAGMRFLISNGKAASAVPASRSRYKWCAMIRAQRLSAEESPAYRLPAAHRVGHP